MGAPNIGADIYTYLIGQGVTPITIYELAAQPINQIAIIEYDRRSTRTHGKQANPGGIKFDTSRFQILSRHTSAQTALMNILSIIDLLDGLGDTTINGVEYTDIFKINGPAVMQRGETGSKTFYAEFQAQAIRS